MPIRGSRSRLGGTADRRLCEHRSAAMGRAVPPSSAPNRIVNVRALWAGSVASAVVAALVAVVGVVIPLASTGSWAASIATALVDLAIGLCILTLVRSLLARTTQRVLPGPWRAPDRYDPVTPPPDYP